MRVSEAECGRLVVRRTAAVHSEAEEDYPDELGAVVVEFHETSCCRENDFSLFPFLEAGSYIYNITLKN